LSEKLIPPRPCLYSRLIQAGIDIFSRRDYREIIVDSLNYCIKEKELVVYGWVRRKGLVNIEFV